MSSDKQRQAFSDDTAAMQRALNLARLGRGTVEPNPCVGAVLVDDQGQLLAEGWHERFGGPHAEVNALARCRDPRGATLYVTLEPCSHFGKTPPCVQAVIAAGIKRVVVGAIDPNPLVSGQGIAQLQAAGVAVETGLCKDEAERLIAPFRRLMQSQRPWVHAKWAMSWDGKLAARTGHSQWISNAASRQVVHTLRGQMDAIVVGIGTALADNPQLTARPPGPRRALRVVVDSRGRLPLESELVRTAREVPVLIATTAACPIDHRDQLANSGVEVLELPSGADGRVSLAALLSELGRRQCTHVLMEGGGGLLGTAFDGGLVDEVHVFVAPKIVGGAAAISPVAGLGRSEIPVGPTLEHVTWQAIGDDLYLHGDCRHDDARTP